MRRIVVSMVAAALLCGCGAAATPTTQTSPAGSSSAAATPAAAGAVPQALAFSAPRVGGGTLDLSAYAGKPVLLWFWAPT